MNRSLTIIGLLLISLSLTGCVSMKSRREFSKSRYGHGGLVDAPDNTPRSRLDQVKRVFNSPRF